MDLRLCPSCGQSVLDDDAQTCPFCGAAMDGSDQGRKAPGGKAPRTKPVPGRAAPAPTADKPHVPSTPGKPARSESRPVQSGMRAIKPSADEDDPFGLGSGATTADVIQALSKPEKGRLLRVVCPMCDHAGFVAKSAIGKSVRCANEKCMVPVFTVPDPDAPVTDRVPRRRSGADHAAESTANGLGAKRNPLIVYGVAGAVLLSLTIGLVQFLNRPPARSPDLDKPVEIPAGGYGPDPEEEARAAAALAAAAQEAAALNDPVRIATRLAKRMIQSARHPSNRDKALARRMTADIYLRLNQPAEAAQEFAQLLSLNRQASYYQVEPRLSNYWRKRSSGDAAGAKAEFEQITKDAAAIPLSGRDGLETALAFASALIAEGKTADAVALVQKQQKDPTIAFRVDAMSSTAWFFTSARLRDIGMSPFAVSDVFAWHNALQTSVAVDLACHRQWKDAIAWVSTHAGKREAGDSLAAIAEIAAFSNASLTVLQQIEAAAAAVHPLVGLRVRCVVAAELKDASRLEAITAAVASLPSPPALSFPKIGEMLQFSLPDFTEPQLAAVALTEFARAAVMCMDVAKAEKAIRQLTEQMLAIAPPVAATRRTLLEIESQGDVIRKRLSDELRIASDAEIASTFRNYRRKVDSLSVAAEVRRLSLIRMLARIIRAGGVQPVQTVLADANFGLRPEILMDRLGGLLAAAAIQTDRSFPEAETADVDLQVPLPTRTAELPEIRVSPIIVQAWQLVQQGRPAEAAMFLEGGSTDLPGLREAVLNEIVAHAAARAEAPEPVYGVIGRIKNAVWRENMLEAVGRLCTAHGLEKQCEQWIEAQKSMPGTEEVTAFYGLAVGLIERAKSTTEQTQPQTSSTSK